MANLEALSKTLSHALRHAPGEYGLALDKEGWVNIDDLVRALNARGWNIGRQDLANTIEQSVNKRHEIAGNGIRAFYGHSTEAKIEKTASAPPALLYHGTSVNTLAAILTHGLQPMSRQYVHLSIDVPTANMVAQRKPGKSVILEVQALEAWQHGTGFYIEKNGVWLADAVPAAYLKEMR